MPSRTSSFVKAMPSMPPSLAAWRTITASNQPQRRRRPGHRAEFPAALAQAAPDVVVQLGRKRALADARGVCLGNAEHIADGGRSGSAADRDLTGQGVRGRNEGVGAVIDVEHRPLSALEQDSLAAPPGGGEAAGRQTGPAYWRRSGAIATSSATRVSRSTGGWP